MAVKDLGMAEDVVPKVSNAKGLKCNRVSFRCTLKFAARKTTTEFEH